MLASVEHEAVAIRMLDFDAAPADLLRAAMDGEGWGQFYIPIRLASPSATTGLILAFSRSR